MAEATADFRKSMAMFEARQMAGGIGGGETIRQQKTQRQMKQLQGAALINPAMRHTEL